MACPYFLPSHPLLGPCLSTLSLAASPARGARSTHALLNPCLQVHASCAHRMQLTVVSKKKEEGPPMKVGARCSTIPVQPSTPGALLSSTNACERC